MISGASEEELELANVIADKLLLQKENQELKEKIERIREIVENSDWRLDDVHDLIDGYNEIAKIII